MEIDVIANQCALLVWQSVLLKSANCLAFYGDTDCHVAALLAMTSD